MSDSWIILIPENPEHVPSVQNQQCAEAKLRELCPSAAEFCVVVTDNLRFEDCGENFGAISCPDCGRELELGWWQDRMSEDYTEAGSFKLQRFKLPFCGIERTLHELKYEWPMGFARFALKARDANIGLLPADYLASLESALGCPLRVIYRRV